MTSTKPTETVLDRIDTDLDAALERLFRLVRFQSVSTDPAYAVECRKAADWLAGDLAAIGFEVRIAETPGHPIVVGHHPGPRGGERAPHLLFYGHYDVQPVDPIGLWQGDPFAPELRVREDGSRYIHGRGAADDKGQLMTFVEACRAWKAATGALPCRVSVLIEGEEESGGASLPAFLDAHRDELTADIALICDTGMFDAGTPAITTMLRGNVADEVTVHAASRDLHSGMYGGAAQNPIHVLTRILAAMHDDDGRIAIPGFYEGVHDVPPAIKAQWDRLGFDAGAFLGAIGLSEPWGRHGYSALEHLWSRPTAEVNGIWGGYTGAGFKTVIPAEASAKVSFRLVGDQDPERVRERFRAFVRDRLPADCRAEFTGRAGFKTVIPAEASAKVSFRLVGDQDPERVRERFRAFVRDRLPADCRAEFTGRAGGFATVMPTADPAFEKARRALTEEWGREAAFIGCGGSIPVVGLLKSRLGMDSLLIGFALDDDRMHSPNEKYELTSFHKGARSWARVLGALAG